MPNKAQHIGNYPFSQADKLLFDANIWLLLFGPMGNPTDRRVARYSAAYQRILLANSTIFLDALVLSEFVNRFARLEYKRMRPTEPPSNFKAFRNSATFSTIASDIAASLRRITSHAQCVDNGFATMDIAALLAEFEGGSTDINDQIIAQLCRIEGFTLITDDADFKALDVELLTANNRLLL